MTHHVNSLYFMSYDFYFYFYFFHGFLHVELNFTNSSTFSSKEKTSMILTRNDHPPVQWAMPLVLSGLINKNIASKLKIEVVSSQPRLSGLIWVYNATSRGWSNFCKDILVAFPMFHLQLIIKSHVCHESLTYYVRDSINWSQR